MLRLLVGLLASFFRSSWAFFLHLSNFSIGAYSVCSSGSAAWKRFSVSCSSFVVGGELARSLLICVICGVIKMGEFCC